MRYEQAKPKLKDALSEALQVPAELVGRAGSGDGELDAELRACGHRFVVEFKSSASADLVGSGLAVLDRVANARPDAIPLLVVPYMGDVGRGLCRERGVSWLDLSGNAFIEGEGLRIHVQGRPNAYARPGRPRTLFAPKSSRVARTFLHHPEREFTAAELVDETGIDRGNMSKLLSRYRQAGLLSVRGRRRGARWSVIDPGLLLSTWHEAYDFERHTIRRGMIVARSGTDLLARLAEAFDRAGVDYAATGLAAAWLIQPWATHRLVTVFTPDWPPEGLLQGLGYLDEPRGANLWLVQPDDRGVLSAAGETNGIRHTSAVQTYVDLKGQPERSQEAADELLKAIHRDWADGCA